LPRPESDSPSPGRATSGGPGPAESSDPRRELLLDLLQAALACVDGRRCVSEALRGAAGAPPRPRAGAAPVWLAAVGKAAPAMALGAHDALGADLARALVITREGHAPAQLSALPNVEVIASAHPVPDERSLAAGRRLLEWVDGLPPEAWPLFLVSGGASSLVEVLKEGTSLGDLERFTQRELAAGTAIGELNARRIALSHIKGGKLTARLRGRAATALFVSDVPGNDPAVIGSGLLGPAADGPDAIERAIVASVDEAVGAAAAAARGAGLSVHAPTQRFAGEAARLAARFAHELLLTASEVCVWGGESTVQLPPRPGRGGRNQHLALAAARLIAGQSDLMLLAAGTDGTDGVTEDAGALVDADSCARIALAGLDVDGCLAGADSGSALAAAGDLLHTGPTGTNVGDLVIGLRLSPEAGLRALGARRGGMRSRVL
jgi:glycerate 2-kinase